MNSHFFLANATLEDLKRGFLEEEEQFICICCGESVEKGIIYPADGIHYEAGRYIRLHVEKQHGSPFAYLLSLDKQVTGLSELQKNLLAMFYQGKTDAEVQKELGIGSSSTIRNHRFALREKERQARAFLAIMELYRDNDKDATRQQNQQLHGPEESLKKTSKGRMETMKRREELKQMAKEMKIEGGVFLVRNHRNGKVWLESTRNFKTMNGHEFSLGMGSHMNSELQREWKEFGSEAFSFEILEKLEQKETGYFDEKDALKKLKDKWLKELSPYGEAGYNSPKEEDR